MALIIFTRSTTFTLPIIGRTVGDHLHLKAIKTAQVLGVRNSAFMGENALPFSGMFNLAPSGQALEKAAKDVWLRQLLLTT